MKERTNYLILVVCEDVSTEDLDEEMRMYLRTNTYLTRDNKWFWEKLLYAMPRKPLVKLKEDLNVQEDADWCGVHALARAQQTELDQLAADVGDNCQQHQYHGNIAQQGIQADVHVGSRHNRDDIPLVEGV